MLSALFGFYVGNFSSYNKTYGSLAGVIVFLLWLWITNLALLFGAELDAELERGRELRRGHRGRGDRAAAAPRHPQHREGGEEAAEDVAGARAAAQRGHDDDPETTGRPPSDGTAPTPTRRRAEGAAGRLRGGR